MKDINRSIEHIDKTYGRYEEIVLEDDTEVLVEVGALTLPIYGMD